MGKLIKDRTILWIISILVLIGCVIVTTILLYSNKRFIIYDEIHIPVYDKNSSLLIKSDTLTNKKRSNLLYFYQDPESYSFIKGLNLKEIRVCGEDTLFLFTYNKKVSIAVVYASFLDDIDLSKIEIQKADIKESPLYVLQSAASMYPIGSSFIFYHIRKTTYSGLVLQMPYSSNYFNFYRSSDSCYVKFNTDKVALKMMGKKNGYLTLVSKSARKTDFYISLSKVFKMKVLIIGCPINNEKTDEQDFNLIAKKFIEFKQLTMKH
jgi:hypothetical protein